MAVSVLEVLKKNGTHSYCSQLVFVYQFYFTSSGHWICFIFCFTFLCLSPASSPFSPSPPLNLEQWMDRSVSDLALPSFSHAFTPEFFGCETNLPTIGVLPLSVQFNRCWHVGGYPWVYKIRFPYLLLTPHWSHSLCVLLGMKVQLSVVLCLYCPALQFLCTYSPSAVFEMLTLYDLNRNCKNETNP